MGSELSFCPSRDGRSLDALMLRVKDGDFERGQWLCVTRSGSAARWRRRGTEVLARYTGLMTPKLRSIRTHRRDASVTRREVSSAIRDVAVAQDAPRPARVTGRAKNARTEAGVSTNVAGRYLGLVRRASSVKPARRPKEKRKPEGTVRVVDEPLKK